MSDTAATKLTAAVTMLAAVGALLGLMSNSGAPLTDSENAAANAPVIRMVG
jgi:hypothetical protein